MRAIVIAALAGLILAGTARAEVVERWDAGFRISNRATIAAPPDKVYAALGRIGQWWNGAHSYSGKAANMTMPLEAGACFCEALPNGGSVKHGEVLMVMPGKAVRFAGALGPLQESGVGAVMTFTLKPVAGGTEVTQTYDIGGARPAVVKFADPVDSVVGEQLTRLKAYVETGKPD